jgi:hypothetical protein
MSYSTIYKVYQPKVISYAEFGNGWGSGPVLWDHLAHVRLNSENEFANGYKRVWGLFFNPAIPEHHRIALAFTFDHAVCQPDKLIELADACEKIWPEIKAWKPHNADHSGSFAPKLKEIAAKKDARLVGVSLNFISVSDMCSGEDVRKLMMHTIFRLESKAA